MSEEDTMTGGRNETTLDRILESPRQKKEQHPEALDASLSDTDCRLGYLELAGMALVARRGFRDFEGESWGADELLSDDELALIDFVRQQTFGQHTPITQDLILGLVGPRHYETAPDTLEEIANHLASFRHLFDSQYDRSERFRTLLRSLDSPRDEGSEAETVKLLKTIGKYHFVLPDELIVTSIANAYGRGDGQPTAAQGRISLNHEWGEARLWKALRTAFRTEGVCKPEEKEIIERLLTNEYSEVHYGDSEDVFLVGMYSRALYREAVLSSFYEEFSSSTLDVTPQDLDAILRDKISHRALEHALALFEQDQRQMNFSETFPPGTIIPLKDEIKKQILLKTNDQSYMERGLAYVTAQISLLRDTIAEANKIILGDADGSRDTFMRSRLQPLVAYRAEDRGLNYETLSASILEGTGS